MKEIDSNYFGYIPSDGECLLRINKKKVLPYVTDGFTLLLEGFITKENVEYASSLSKRPKKNLTLYQRNSNFTLDNLSNKLSQ